MYIWTTKILFFSNKDEWTLIAYSFHRKFSAARFRAENNAFAFSWQFNSRYRMADGRFCLLARRAMQCVGCIRFSYCMNSRQYIWTLLCSIEYLREKDCVSVHVKLFSREWFNHFGQNFIQSFPARERPIFHYLVSKEGIEIKRLVFQALFLNYSAHFGPDIMSGTNFQFIKFVTSISFEIVLLLSTCLHLFVFLCSRTVNYIFPSFPIPGTVVFLSFNNLYSLSFWKYFLRLKRFWRRYP